MEAQIGVHPQGPSADPPVGPGLMGDERLARLVAGGSERAFATLYRRYHQPLYRYCRSIVRNEADAHDALQSAFAGALVALRSGRRDAPLKPWLFRIAHNESVSLLRRRRPEAELRETLESPAASLQEAAEDRARLATLVADLRDLPERQRGALVMRELSGLSYEEIGLAFGISAAAAKQTVFEARRSLMEFSQGRAMSCDEILRIVSERDGRMLRGRRVRAHLRECSGCAAFAAAIPARRSDLHALSPALPAVAASGVFAKLAGSGSGHGSGAGIVAGATGKTVGVAISVKGLAAGVAVVAAAAAGAGAVRHFTTVSQAATHSAPAHSQRTPAGAGASPEVAPTLSAHPGGTVARPGSIVRRPADGHAPGSTGSRVLGTRSNPGAVSRARGAPASGSAASGSAASGNSAGRNPGVALLPVRGHSSASSSRAGSAADPARSGHGLPTGSRNGTQGRASARSANHSGGSSDADGSGASSGAPGADHPASSPGADHSTASPGATAPGGSGTGSGQPPVAAGAGGSDTPRPATSTASTSGTAAAPEGRLPSSAASAAPSGSLRASRSTT